MSLLKKLRPKAKENTEEKASGKSEGAKQMAMLRRLPKLLRFIPGTAQDLRMFFLTMRYWLAGSEQNITNMVLSLVNRYAAPERQNFKL
jgi:magnesium chelatase subunit H